MNSKKELEKLVAPGALADFLGCSLRTVRRLTAAGVIPCVRVGVKLARYRLEDVTASLLTGGKRHQQEHENQEEDI